jgi:hypothetical protein
MNRKQGNLIYVILIISMCLLIIGCGTTNAQKKTTGGVALGALAGGLLGGTSGAVVGSAVGGVAGYAVGTEQDRHKEKVELERERLAIEKSKITKDPNTAYRPQNRNSLVGSTWRIISIVSDATYPDYHSMVVSFQTNSKMTTLTVLKNGETTTYAETYQVIDDALVISGKENGKDYVTNGKYSINGKQMIFLAPGYRIVLEEIEEKV